MACRLESSPPGASDAGVSLSIEVDTVLASKPAAAQLRERLLPLLVAGRKVVVVATGIRHCMPAGAAFAGLCGQLAATLRVADAAPADIGIVIDYPGLSPQVAWRIRCGRLGVGPLYICLNEVPDRHWPLLWQLRSNRMLRPVITATVTSRCRLLAAEPASAVLPGLGILAPAGTAWAGQRVDIARCLTTSARRDALQSAVMAGERLHESTRWPTASMRHDAWLNRRLAIELVGIGDLVRGHGLEPGSACALEFASQLLQQARDVLQEQSRRIAGVAGAVPALERCDPGRSLPGGRLRSGWDERWQQALELHRVRHRNLLVMQPWSVFPRHRPVDFRYVSLLPLLRLADTLVFPRPPSIAHWNIREFKSFYQCMRAALQQREASHQIAEHV